MKCCLRRVVTTPVAITILANLMIISSLRHIDSVPSVVIPLGILNFAEVPVASVDPCELPARVVTTPVEITIFRIL